MAASPASTLELAGEGLVLRPWDERLVEQMARWGVRGFPYAAFDLAYLADPVRAAATLAWTREPDQHIHLVACESGRAVGRVSVNLEDAAGLYLWAVHVPPEHEGRGIARRMLRVVIPWLQANHPARDVVLTTNTFAERAHATYRSLGFEITDTRWQPDASLSAALWKLPPEARRPIESHIRHLNGRWEVRVNLMKLRAAGLLSPSPRYGVHSHDTNSP